MDTIKNIAIMFLSIFFESLPFLILGSFISACIETYISDEQISKLIPKNKILACIVGIFLGFFIPACDCAVIPVSRRLLKKKVPISVAISFMLASPIINPVVLLSTYYAFYRTNPEIFWYRFIFGILISFIIGIIIGIIFSNKNIIISNDECDLHLHHDKRSLKGNVISIIKHTGIDTFEILKYLMCGALIASIVQVLLPRSILIFFNNNSILSIIALMIFAYFISLCSTSDSFVGKSLLSIFPKSAILAYLLLGPMIDIKNTIVLFGNYKKSFVISLISLIFIMIFVSMVVFI